MPPPGLFVMTEAPQAPGTSIAIVELLDATQRAARLAPASSTASPRLAPLAMPDAD